MGPLLLMVGLGLIMVGAVLWFTWARGLWRSVVAFALAGIGVGAVLSVLVSYLRQGCYRARGLMRSAA